jgi:tetratricopeptide (TPR) repeat protein
MNKPQWITAGIAILIVAGLYAATQKQIFGEAQAKKPVAVMHEETSLSVDTILFHAREALTPEQTTRLNFLEHSISRGDVKDQQLHIYHQLAAFWRDSARKFEPFAWYTAEAARLENSEKSLTFAAHLFLNRLVQETNPQVKEWEAFQSKDLFDRSLKLNPANDSSKIGLGSVYLYGGIAMPMQGISMIREVADRDSGNIYAQWTLGQASLYSGQTDKALERFKRVVRLDPKSPDGYLMVADVSEQMGNKKEAIEWYTKVLPLIGNVNISHEIEARIAELKK